MNGSPPHAADSEMPAAGAPAPGRLRRLREALRGHGLGDRRRSSRIRLARILDLFEEHVYAGEITPDGRYVHHASTTTVRELIGGSIPDDVETGRFWESRIAPADWAQYHAFNRHLLAGEDAEVTYRVAGLDGATRVLRDRA